MGGADGLRGYVVQALITLVESLGDLAWSTVTIEPNDESEKVDIKWTSENRTVRFAQVKSSKNSITLPIVKGWINELKQTISSERIELILVGPTTLGVLEIGNSLGVTIPTPKNLNLRGFRAEAAHLLDAFCTNHNLGQRSFDEREFLVEAITGHLVELGAEQRPLSRADFIGLLTKWISQFKLPTSLIDADARDELLSRFPRNPFFTGRADILAMLEESIIGYKSLDSPITIALTGLGGQGKTQVALEFLHNASRKHNDLLWLNASSSLSLGGDLATWARSRKLVGVNSSNAEAADKANSWLKKNNCWIAVLDNVDNVEIIDFLVYGRRFGHVLITTRLQDLQPIPAKMIALDTWRRSESTIFLLRRTGRNNLNGNDAASVDEISNELGDLPLALEQASAYLVSKQVTFASYLKSFKTRRLALLESSPPIVGDYRKTVSTTWSLNVSAVREESPAAFDLLNFASFLDSESIPFELIANGADYLGRRISTALQGFYPSEDETLIDELLAPLVNYSLVKKTYSNRSFSVHRLVQEVTRGNLPARLASAYRKLLLRAVAKCFPIVRPDSWLYFKRLLSHAVTVVANAMEAELKNEENATLLHRIAHAMEYDGDYYLAYSIYSAL